MRLAILLSWYEIWTSKTNHILFITQEGSYLTKPSAFLSELQQQEYLQGKGAPSPLNA
ncbi:MAG: hypothetical protein K2X39_03275 [Silvanigrellaceae bacterium]|nr:hypothetical protein [Silvanigrellaceae bacterium]